MHQQLALVVQEVHQPPQQVVLVEDRLQTQAVLTSQLALLAFPEVLEASPVEQVALQEQQVLANLLAQEAFPVELEVLVSQLVLLASPVELEESLVVLVAFPGSIHWL